MNFKIKNKLILVFILSLVGGLSSPANAGWFSSDCYYLPIPCAEGEKLEDSNPPPPAYQVSVSDFNSRVSSVCSQADTSNSFITDATTCAAKQEECRNGSTGYGACLKRDCTLDQNSQTYSCTKDPFADCQYSADAWIDTLKRTEPSCQIQYFNITPTTTTAATTPQCDATNYLQNCALSDPQEAACNDISCDVNGRCHYVGHASGEYTWVGGSGGVRSHHPLPTNHPSCASSFSNKPYAYCTNSGLSSLDYCFLADQPLANAGTGTSNCSYVVGFPCLANLNLGSTGTTTTTTGTTTTTSGTTTTTTTTGGSCPGSGLVCPAGTCPTSSCLNYSLDPTVGAGQPAWPPECCQ